MSVIWLGIEITGLYNLSNLERLSLGGNKITEIKGLDTLYNLKHLGLSDNKITEIKGLASLQSLESLYLVQNEIREIDLEVFEKLPKLKTVELFRNPLRYNYNKVTKNGLKIIH